MMSCCNGKSQATPKIVYACAGCSDVGEVSDLVSRKMREKGYAQPTASCLAGISAGIQTFIDAAKGIEEVITVDGCGMRCAKKIIESIGIAPKVYVLTEMGLEKGKTKISEDLIDDLYQKITLLRNHEAYTQ
jgi:uncharacterized metal-binding protein